MERAALSSLVPCPRLAAMAGRAENGTFADFLRELLAFESGIDPRKLDWYLSSWDSPAISAPQVSAPGRAIRDPHTGNLEIRRMTVRDYFAALGVGELFEPENPESLRAMQYRSMNALGFVGYQIGEAILVTTGHYTPERVTRGAQTWDRYYFGSVDPSAWRNGCRELVYRIPGTAKDIVATDVNCWRGSFTGKHGIFALADLFVPEKQERVVREIMRSNLATIREQLLRDGDPLERALERVTCTASGLLAAAHLCGAFAAAEFLRSGAIGSDELGTSLARYLDQFAGYDVPAELGLSC